MRSKKDTLPEQSKLDTMNCDYVDTYSIKLMHSKTVYDLNAILIKMFSNSPKWIVMLMAIRDKLIQYFGLKTQKNPFVIEEFIKSLDSNEHKLGILDVILKNKSEIIVGLDDRHLNFKSSLYLETIETKQNVYLSTVVNFNNVWGRLYFLMISPFHHVIIKTLLNCLYK